MTTKELRRPVTTHKEGLSSREDGGRFPYENETSSRKAHSI